MTHILVSDYLGGHSDPMVREAGRLFRELEMQYPSNIVEERNVLWNMLKKVAWGTDVADKAFPLFDDSEREVWREILDEDPIKCSSSG